MLVIQGGTKTIDCSWKSLRSQIHRNKKYILLNEFCCIIEWTNYQFSLSVRELPNSFIKKIKYVFIKVDTLIKSITVQWEHKVKEIHALITIKVSWKNAYQIQAWLKCVFFLLIYVIFLPFQDTQDLLHVPIASSSFSVSSLSKTPSYPP